jgi:hypothetical protein
MRGTGQTHYPYRTDEYCQGGCGSLLSGYNAHVLCSVCRPKARDQAINHGDRNAHTMLSLTRTPTREFHRRPVFGFEPPSGKVRRKGRHRGIDRL